MRFRPTTLIFRSSGRWFGINTPSGVLTADFVAQGEARAPRIRGSVEVTKPGFGKIQFDSFRIARVEVTNNHIELSDMILAVDNHQAVAQGYLPWSWSGVTIPRNRPLEFTANLNKEDLSILAAFSSEIDAARTSGALSAVFNLTGTLADAKLNGSMTLNNGRLSLKGFTNDFTNVTADIKFVDKRISVNQLTADSSDGGSVAVQPGGYIDIGTEGNSAINLLVVATGLKVAEKNVLGYNEDVSGQVDAGLSVTGNDLRRPVIANAPVAATAGGINISNAKLVFAVPENMQTKPIQPLFVDPQLNNVSINLGNDVVVQPPKMRLTVTGEGALKGRVSQINLSMKLTIQSGTIALAVSRLRILSGGTISVSYAPPAAPEVAVEGLRATTMVTATDTLGQTQRYQITVDVNGPVTSLHIGLTSNPPGLTREQMLAALGHVEGIFASGESQFQSELRNALTAVGTSAVFAPIEEFLCGETRI